MTESIILDRCLAGMDSRFNHKGLQGLKGGHEGFFIVSFVFPLVSFALAESYKLVPPALYKSLTKSYHFALPAGG